MGNIILAVLFFLLAVACLIGVYRFAQWVFAKLGIDIPQQVYQIIGVIIVILILIWFVQALLGSGPMPWHPGYFSR